MANEMKLTKKLQAEILKAYNAYWDSYFNGDMRAFASMLDESVQIIGSSENEVFRNKASAVKFYKATAGQVTGKTALRNRRISMRPVENNIMITEQSDFYALIEDEWTFYGHGRISTLMRKTGKAWKILYEHGSLPDSKAGEGEQINTERIKAENLQLRDAVKRRTIELEHKNWELKIEAALERVRAVAMSMRKPDELSDIGETVFRELQALGFAALRNTEILIDNDTKESVLSYYYSDYGVSGAIEVFYNDHPIVKNWAHEMKKASDAFAEVIISENEMEAWRKYREEIGYVPDPKLEAAKSVWYYSYSTGLGALSVSSFTPITEEQMNVLGRFRNVFGLAYRRYVDVALAEAQAREARIEAALERVRSRTMGMQRSDELAEAASLLFKQVNELGIQTWTSGFNIWEEDDASFIGYNPTPTGGIADPYHIPSTENSFFIKIYEAKKRREDFIVFESEGESLAETYRYMKTLPVVKDVLKNIEDSGFQMPTFQINHCVFFSQGFLLFITLEPYPRAHDIFKRFGKVFEQTYTRFLDLQKAEAQAREAQIEAALERVRSRTMVMHSSDDVSVATAVLFTELEKLDIETMRCGVAIINEDQTMETWTTTSTDEGKVMRVVGLLDMKIHPLLQGSFRAWKSGEEFYTYHLAGKDMQKYYEFLTSSPTFTMPKQEQELPEHICNVFYFKEGGLYTFSLQPHDDGAIQVLRRFTSVFSLTYRRYQDLKQAEAQAREAQIEASLERVRANAMAMHRSDELSDVLAVLFEQFDVLNIRPVDVHLDLFDLEKNTFSYRATGKEGKRVIAEQIVDLDSRPEWQALVEKWKKGKPNTVDFSYYPKEVIRELMAFFPDIWAAMPEDAIMSPEDFPNGIFDALGYCKFGYIGFHHHRKATEEEQRILIRFANEFERLYQRFLDLQKAEAQARQAVQQASLDRVRAEIASMRTAADLQRITPLIWRELTTLGVPFFRCGVFIIDEATEQAHVYLSTPSGEAVAALHLKFDSAPVIQATVQHWRQQQVYCEEWDREQFTAWTQSILKQGLIDSPEKYQGGGEAPEKLVLQFVPFMQGMLYIGSNAALSDDEIEIGQALANAFGVAYARYEDFQRLEAAKVQVEATLENLQRTQQQLITQEKLASLGQLTAGIAHEIKNPLNFVNNFAQLSAELTDEFAKELDANADKTIAEVRGALEELLADLRMNNVKINEHGKRADGIVKSMMQHARGSSGQREMTDINHLLDEAVNLTYHGMRANDASFNITIEKDYDETIGRLNVVPQDLSRVFLNVVNNACYAAFQKQKANSKKQTASEKDFSPTIFVSTKNVEDKIEIRIRDNGNGIPPDIREKIFNPFFTTKPTGQGTGLGLSISYDIIVQEHRGEIKVETEEGKFTEFVVRLPRGA